jgi:hypothetical protein
VEANGASLPGYFPCLPEPVRQAGRGIIAGHMDIPPYLEEQVRSGKVVLVLGAGASIGALDAIGKRAPKTDELRDLLADKFLGGKLKNTADTASATEFPRRVC